MNYSYIMGVNNKKQQKFIKNSWYFYVFNIKFKRQKEETNDNLKRY